MLSGRQDSQHRVVVTGIGVVAPNAIGRAGFWTALKEGRSGISKISGFDTVACPASIGGEIQNFPAEEILGPTGFRYVGRATKFLCASIRLAIEDAGLSEGEPLGEETGVIAGTSFGNLPQTTTYTQKILTKHPAKLLPMDGYDGALNSATNFASVFFKLRACVRTVSCGHSSSTDAIIDAVRMIRTGRARRVVAGGVEQLSPDHLLTYGLNGALATDSDAVPMPYDRKRAGVVLGEGSWMLMLERFDEAQARGAKMYGEVAGFSSLFTGRASATSDRKQQRVAQVIEMALADAGIQPSDVDVIVSAGNSSTEADAVEGRAIAGFFGDRALLTAPKSMTGEIGGTSGAMQAAVALFSLEQGIVPATLHTSEVDEATGIKRLASAPVAMEARAIVADTVDFASNTACLILKRA